MCFCSLSLSSNDIEYLENETMVLFADHSYSMSHLNNSVRQPIDGAKKKNCACEVFFVKLCSARNYPSCGVLLNFARLEITLHVEKLPTNIIQEISGYSMIPKFFSQIILKSTQFNKLSSYLLLITPVNK